MENLRSRSQVIGIALLIGVLLVGFVPTGAVATEPPDRPVILTLEGLSDILSRLQERLSSLQARPGERFDEKLEELIGLIEELLDQEPPPAEGEEGLPLKIRIIRIDLRLHRLVHILDEIVDEAEDTPARPAVRESIDDLRHWLDGYIEGATARMSPAEADRFEEAARAMIRAFAGEILGIAKRADPPDHPVLARLVDRLEDLLFRLDGFILRNFPPSPQTP